jgi:hypothetical protein
MIPPLLLAGGIVGGVSQIGGAISNLFGAKKRNKQLDAFGREVDAMQINPIYGQNYGLTQTQLQGRMAGASQAEQNINQQAANTQANINRGATDPMQAILGAGAVQGQTSQAFNELAGQEQADYANRLQRMMQAGMSKAEAEDQLRMQKLQMKSQIQGAIAQNKQNAVQGLVNAGTGIGNILTGLGTPAKTG